MSFNRYLIKNNKLNESNIWSITVKFFWQRVNLLGNIFNPISLIQYIAYVSNNNFIFIKESKIDRHIDI